MIKKIVTSMITDCGNDVGQKDKYTLLYTLIVFIA